MTAIRVGAFFRALLVAAFCALLLGGCAALDTDRDDDSLQEVLARVTGDGSGQATDDQEPLQPRVTEGKRTPTKNRETRSSPVRARSSTKRPRARARPHAPPRRARWC
ncbi:MAG: hypothetical protein U5L11_00410 [Arhodomonas sp.]|nr:hypothetical protein [Arhodomonas sp.]